MIRGFSRIWLVGRFLSLCNHGGGYVGGKILGHFVTGGLLISGLVTIILI